MRDQKFKKPVRILMVAINGYGHYYLKSLLEEVAEEAGQLPEVVKSLIMFGIGLGYQIEALFAQKEVEKLFLCEPNRDFFFASLFAIDWQHILTDADKNNRRIYINIACGHSGTATHHHHHHHGSPSNQINGIKLT